jgi:hypothetical protein
MNRNSGEEQRSRVQVAQIVQAGMGSGGAEGVSASLYLLISADTLSG